MADLSVTDANFPVIIRRRDARAAGLKRYFTGKPCKQGHVSERHVVGGGCLACALARHRAWYAENRDHAIRYVAAWNGRNRDRVLSRRRKKYHAGPKLPAKRRPYTSAQLGTKAAWKRANPEKVRLSARRAYAKDPSKSAAKVHKRRAHRVANGGEFTADDVAFIRKMQKDRCPVCRMALKGKGQIDHKVPLSKGGSNDRANIELLCGPCNGSKSARDPIEFMQSRGFLL